MGVGQVHPQTPPSYPRVTSLSSLLLNTTLRIFKFFRSFNFARSANYQRKLMTSISKLVCSEVSALNGNSFLSLDFFFKFLFYFIFCTQSPCKILHFYVSPFTSFLMVSFLGQKSGIAHFKDNQVEKVQSI